MNGRKEKLNRTVLSVNLFDRQDFGNGPLSIRRSSKTKKILCWCLSVVVIAVLQVSTSSAREPSAREPQQRANEATISATASANTVQVAEPFTVKIECITPVGMKVSFPAVIEKLGEFDVIDHRDEVDIPTAASDERRRWTRHMTLESITTGELSIPSIEVQVSGTNDAERLTSESLSIRVLSVLEDRPDPTSFRDLKPLIEIEIPDRRSFAWVWWTFGGIVGVSILGGAILAVTRRSRFITPAAWASREFDQLEDSFSGMGDNLAASDGSELVAYRLSAIIREYLEMQFDVTAPTLTTDELLQALKANHDVNEQAAQGIQELFERADQAKYAGVQLSGDELQTSIENGRKIVEQIANQTSLHQ